MFGTIIKFAAKGYATFLALVALTVLVVFVIFAGLISFVQAVVS